MIDSFWNTRIHERKFRIERTKYIIIDVQQTVPCAELEGERSKIGIRPLPTNKKNPLEPSLPVIFFWIRALVFNSKWIIENKFKFNGFEKCKRKLNSSEQRSGAKSRLMTPSEFHVTIFRHLKPNRCIINNPFLYVVIYVTRISWSVYQRSINLLKYTRYASVLWPNIASILH